MRRISGGPPKIPRRLAIYDDDGSCALHAETIYVRSTNVSMFAVYDRNTDSVEIAPEVKWPLDGLTYAPYDGGHGGGPKSLLYKQTVRLASEPVDYASEDALAGAIEAFIRRWMHLPTDRDYVIAMTYAFLTWLGDCFPALPYLRVRGDLGGGKSRFLKTIGAICYCPIFASGATTASPLYRLLESLPRATFILDEMDLDRSGGKGSPEALEIVKILNQGYEKGAHVLRTAKDSPDMETDAFDTFGPKILASRNLFPDAATESRCLTIALPAEDPQGVPRNLGTSFWDEAMRLRNQLLLWRFRRFSIYKEMPDVPIPGATPRTEMLIAPMTLIFTDSVKKQNIIAFAREMDKDNRSNRAYDWEAEALRALMRYIEHPAGLDEAAQMKIPTDGILSRINEARAADGDAQETKRHLHETLRVRLSLPVKRVHGGDYAVVTTAKLIRSIGARFDIVDDSDTPEASEGAEAACAAQVTEHRDFAHDEPAPPEDEDDEPWQES